MLTLDLITHGAPLLAALQAEGLTPSVETDFDRIIERQDATGKPRTHPMMAPSRNDFVKGDAFWLFLEKDGRDVASLAAKCFDLSNESLESYWRRTSRHQYGRDQDPIVGVDPIVGLLRGKMVYVGELFVHPDIQGNIKTLTRFTRLMQLLAASEWDFDWMFGFVTDDHTKFNRLYSFSLVARHAIEWRDPEPKGRLSSHALLASTHRQIKLLFDPGTP